MYKIHTLNAISNKGLERLPTENYDIGAELNDADGILVRSAKMHDMDLPESLLAIGRAGAGVNNVPVDRMTDKGVVVFNAPGANANAVKELVIAGMLMSIRNIGPAWDFARKLEGSDEEINKATALSCRAVRLASSVWVRSACAWPTRPRRWVCG